MKILSQANVVNYSNNEYRNAKKKACVYLASLNKKKLTKTDFATAAKKYKLSESSIRHAWKNFQDTKGRFVDLRGNKTSINVFDIPECKTVVLHQNAKKFTRREAIEMLIGFMDLNQKKDGTAVEYITDCGITPRSFYLWIRELSLKGTLMGEKVLNIEDYPRVPVVDIIYYHRFPNSRAKRITKLSKTEKAYYRKMFVILHNVLTEQLKAY